MILGGSTNFELKSTGGNKELADKPLYFWIMHLKSEIPSQSWLNLELKSRGNASCMRNGPIRTL